MNDPPTALVGFGNVEGPPVQVHPVRGGMFIEVDVIGNLHPVRGAMCAF